MLWFQSNDEENLVPSRNETVLYWLNERHNFSHQVAVNGDVRTVKV